MIYPSHFPIDRSDEHAEKKVYDFFSRIPPDKFDVFYNVEFSDGNQGDFEIDFIVADLRNGRLNGIVCIEVKGGIVNYDPEMGWTQNGNKMKSSPTTQAMSAMHKVVKRYEAISGPVPFGWMVCFPDGGVPDPDNLPVALTDIQIIDKLRLAYVDEALISFFDDLQENHQGRNGLSLKQYVSGFKNSLIRSCSFVPTLSSKVDHDNQVFLQLTRQQSRLLRSVMDNPRVLVRGTAGSGKTLIAREAAERFRDEGLDVLFLCFNLVLANNLSHFFNKIRSSKTSDLKQNYLEQLSRGEIDPESISEIFFSGSPDGQVTTNGTLRVGTYHSFACSLISRIDREWWNNNVGDAEFWNYNIAAKILELEEEEGIWEKYDVVIVDEGQDFNENWFASLDALLKPEGRQIVFKDNHQNVHNAMCNIPNEDLYFKSNLDENCRNTEEIVKNLRQIIDQDIVTMEGTPEGEPVTIIEYNSDTHQQTQVIYELRRLLSEQQMKPDQILLIMNTEKEDSCMANTQQIDQLALRPVGANGILSDKSINYTHINTFKGLEADIIFILDTDKVADDPKLLYTQASRARNHLYICKKSD